MFLKFIKIKKTTAPCYCGDFQIIETLFTSKNTKTMGEIIYLPIYLFGNIQSPGHDIQKKNYELFLHINNSWEYLVILSRQIIFCGHSLAFCEIFFYFLGTLFVGIEYAKI